MAAHPPCVFLSAGETSGELYATEVARALRARNPDLQLVGVGGDRLAAAGVELWARSEDLAVMGFLEVVKHLPRLRRLATQLAERASQRGVDLFLPVDYPGFHIHVAQQLRKREIPTLDFIPPKTWSWGRWRLRALRRAVRRCAVIFPFEQTYYRQHGIDAHFVGHPLMDLHQAELDAPRTRRDGELLLVPGSRRQELANVGPVLGRVAASLLADGSVRRVVVSQAPHVEDAWLAPLMDACPQAQVSNDELFGRLLGSSAAIVTSGTASLEAALAGVPHAIVYRTSPVTYAIARRLATVSHIGMANIALERRAFPEFLQGDFRVEPLTRCMAGLLDPASASRQDQRASSHELRGLLGGTGAFGLVADMALGMLST